MRRRMMAAWVRAGMGCALLGLVVANAAAGCSVVVQQDVAQCKTDLDCARFPATRCEAGGCVPRTGTPANTSFPPLVNCSSTQECLADRGPNWICRKPEGVCQSLASQDCNRVLGDYKKDNALLIGALLPAVEPPEAAQRWIGLAMQNGLRFAVNDFARGLPPFEDGVRRPVAVVVCNELDDPERAVNHLLTVVKVPAILGGTFSATTARVAEKVSAGNALLLSPTTTTPVAGDPGRLVWRAAPSDDDLGAAMSKVFAQSFEPRVRVAPYNATKTRLVLLHKGDKTPAADGFGKSLAGAIQKTVRLNGAAATDATNNGFFSLVDYGDFDNPQGEDPQNRVISAVATTLVPSALPHVVAILGHAEGVKQVLERIEQGWPSSAGAPKPLYLLAPGLVVPPLLDLMKQDDDLRRRVLAVAPGANPETSSTLQPFLVRYQSVGDGSLAATYGVTSIYDTFYALMYGLASLGKTEPNGARLADSLARLDSGTRIEVGTAGIDAAYKALAADPEGGVPGEIDLEGASGALKFEAATHAAKSDIQVWCGVKAGTNVNFEYAGLTIDAGGTLSGALRSQCSFQ